MGRRTRHPANQTVPRDRAQAAGRSRCDANEYGYDQARHAAGGERGRPAADAGGDALRSARGGLDGRGRRIRSNPSPVADAFLAIVRSTFNGVITDRDRLANQFAFARRLTSSIRMRQLHYPRRLARLKEVCDAIVADMGKM